MWTDEKSALAQADAYLFDLIKVSALRTLERLYTREVGQSRWSKGMCKNLLDVSYQGHQPWRRFRLRWVETDGYSAGLELLPLEPLPPGWQSAPDQEPVEDPEDLELPAEAVAQERGGHVILTDVVRFPFEGSPITNVYEGLVWEMLPAEKITLKLNGDTGALMGWRHEGWFHKGPEQENPLSPQELQKTVESLKIFPGGMTLETSWPSTDQAWHQELLWERSFQEEEVESDYVYASVNRFSGQIAEAVFNVSELIEDLDLTEDQAYELFGGAFEEKFPQATRCGALRRMYAEVPGQAARQHAWVGTAVNNVGPVQILLGPDGKILRADSVG